MSGAILGCHNSRSEGGYWPVGVEGRYGTEYSSWSRTALHNKELPVPKCQCWVYKNPVSDKSEIFLRTVSSSSCLRFHYNTFIGKNVNQCYSPEGNLVTYVKKP